MKNERDAGLLKKLADADIPGQKVSFSRDEAALLGAFDEDALSEHDALESAIDSPRTDFNMS